MESTMNRTNLLATCAVVAFAAATGAALAQQERVPQHQQERGAPAEKIAPQNAPGVRNQGPNSRASAPQNRGRSETTGQAPQDERQGPPSDRNLERERGRSEQPLRSEPNEQNRTPGRAQREDRLNRVPERDRTTGQAPPEDRTNRSSEQNRFEQERSRTDRTEENRATTGQGAAGPRGDVIVNLTPEKRTRIHEVIVNQRNAPRVSSPNFNISIGSRVPRTVRFAAVPRTIVEIEPTWRGFEYFMIGDQMVIVDGRSMEIVAIVDV
jgi:hypothetical protein